MHAAHERPPGLLGQGGRRSRQRERAGLQVVHRRHRRPAGSGSLRARATASTTHQPQASVQVRRQRGRTSPSDASSTRGGFEPCSSPYAGSARSPTASTSFAIVATDAAGNVGPAATRTLDAGGRPRRVGEDGGVDRGLGLAPRLIRPGSAPLRRSPTFAAALPCRRRCAWRGSTAGGHGGPSAESSGLTRGHDLLWAPPRARATVRSEFFGIVQGQFERRGTARRHRPPGHGGREGPDRPLRARDGARSSRAKGTRDWDASDHFIGALASHGIRALPFVWKSPAWISKSANAPPIDTAAHEQAWRDFLKAAVARYGPGGRFWTNRYPGALPRRDATARSPRGRSGTSPT